MSRLYEMEPAEETVVVSRILLHVHRAIDENFPGATPASREFSRTQFSSEQSTAIVHPAASTTDEEPTPKPKKERTLDFPDDQPETPPMSRIEAPEPSGLDAVEAQRRRWVAATAFAVLLIVAAVALARVLRLL